MRGLLLLVVVMVALQARGQVINGPRGPHQHRPQFLDPTPFSLGPQQQPPRPLLSGESRSVIQGPFVDQRPPSLRSQPAQGVGLLPLNPRPNFSEHFEQQEDGGFSEDEVALQGGDFSPLFSDEAYVDPSREHDDNGFSQGDYNVPESQEHGFPSTPQDGSQYDEDSHTQEPIESREEYYQSPVTTHTEGSSRVIPTLQQEQTQLQQPPYQPPQLQQPPYQPPQLRGEPQQDRFPQHRFPGVEDQREQYKQETQEILDIVSLPRPIHRTRRPRPRPQLEAVHRRPTHPNQLPLYNVIGGDLVPLDSQESETRQRPLQVVYDYDEVLEEEEEEEEEEEPDRLAILLLNSRFDCLEKNNGYYADEEVECEVFHYCQDRIKHSWLCPDGASFHQVHLICMPRSEDNICAKSSKFHFVNDYLYKELDDGERNKTYADRYYPVGFEFGVADVDTTGQVAAAQAPQRPLPAYVDHQQPSRQPQQPQYQQDVGDPYVIRRRPEQFSRPQQQQQQQQQQQYNDSPQGFARPPPYRGGSQGFDSLEEALAHRRAG